ncbi:MAG: hypothetical protein ACYSW3_29400, partial [Planctomycetota bacterium]
KDHLFVWFYLTHLLHIECRIVIGECVDGALAVGKKKVGRNESYLVRLLLPMLVFPKLIVPIPLAW